MTDLKNLLTARKAAHGPSGIVSNCDKTVRFEEEDKFEKKRLAGLRLFRVMRAIREWFLWLVRM